MDNIDNEKIIAEYLKKAKKRFYTYFIVMFVGLLSVPLVVGIKPAGKYIAIAIGIGLVIYTFYLYASVSECPICGKPFRSMNQMDFSWKYIPYNCPNCGAHIRKR